MRYIYMKFVFVIFTQFIICVTGERTAVIHTSYGPIQGEQFHSHWTNEKIYAFKGIPYATPPIGDLRFRDPVPPEAWHDIKECISERPFCPQTIGQSSMMDEDCLYLNVYTPQLSSPEFKPLPVVVWIHGGAFVTGSGNYDQGGPDLLIAEGVVVVTFNYRLGALGFLSLGVEDIPGNVGLKDQRLAFLWVLREIKQFGGDCEKITLFGESAGAISAHFHYISPLSTGLFHAIIGDSGSPLACRVRRNGRPFAIQLAKQLGCEVQDTAEIVSCLKAANYTAILGAQALMKAPYQDDKTGLNVFVPVIDKERENLSFLPDFPYNLMKQKKTFFVPILMGVNSDEGILRLITRSEEEFRNITNNLEYISALQVPEEKFSPTVKAERLKEFYFRHSYPKVKGYVDLYTDVLYAYGSIINARYYQQTSHVFLYCFSFDGKYKDKLTKNVELKYNISGVTHTEELNYLFINENINQNIGDGSTESLTMKRMVKMWMNFVKYRRPTVGLDLLLQNAQWLPTTQGKTNHLVIDVNLTMSPQDLLANRASIWDSIYHL